MKHLLNTLALVLCCQLFAACGGLGDTYCEEANDCRGGNDADLNACKASIEGGKNQADAYDCGDDFEDVVACWEENASCQGTSPDRYYTSYDLNTDTDPCSDDEDAFEACLEKGSDLE